MAPKTITIIGSLNMDLVTVTPRIPSGGETLTASSFSTGPGGKGANQAVATARLSCPNPSSTHGPQPTTLGIKMIGAIGSDAFGPVLTSSLQESFVDTTSISVIPSCSTGVAVILVEASLGENRILLSPGANGTLLPKDFEKVESLGTPLPELVILQLEIPLQTVLQIIETAKKAGVPVLLNPAPAVPLLEEVFQGLDHLVLNESEAAILSGRAVEEVEVEGFEWDGVAAEFLRKGVKNLIITLGSKGAFYSSAFEGEGGKSGYVKAEKIKVVDTTAAGDTFVGAYAVQVVSGNGRAMGDIVKLACRAAGKTCEKAGAQAAIPWGDEVEGLL